MSSTTDTSSLTEGLPPLPVAHDGDSPFSPPPEYARLRDTAPVTKVACPTGITAWLVTRYDDVRTVLSDTAHFSSQPGQIAHMLGGMPADDPIPPGFFPRMDGEEHLRYRRFLGPEISKPQRIRELRPILRRIADERLDSLAQGRPPYDLYNDFIIPVTTSTVAQLYGIPVEDGEFFRHVSGIMFTVDPDPGDMAEALQKLGVYMWNLVTQRRAEPGEDVVSRLIVRGETSERPFDDIELMTAASVIMTAATTTSSILNYGLLVLLCHPGQFDALRADFSLVPRAIEEIVRYVSVSTGLCRRAIQDTELGGRRIKAGDYVVAAVQSANRDTTLHPDADEFDTSRRAGIHLGYGYGPHQCVGQQLARLQLTVALETLLSRVPSLRLAVPLEEIEFQTGTAFRKPLALPVAWDAMLPSTPDPVR